MKLPRDVAGNDLVKSLERIGYDRTRQRGDHVTMTTQTNGEHHVTVPLHNPIKIGTLTGILASVAAHLKMSRDELVRALNL